MIVIRIDEARVVTRLPSGAEVHATPQPGQEATARSLGYGDDVAALTRDHDPLHSLLAAWLGYGTSYAMRDAAGEASDDERRLAQLEEHAVMAIQALMVATGRGLPIDRGGR